MKLRPIAVPWTGRLRDHLAEPVSVRHADVVLLVCCFLSGLCDSSTYASWQTFVSMQTGNTIFLALGAANIPANNDYGWARSLISIASFVVGSVFWVQMTRWLGTTRRGTIVASFLLQTVLILVAAALVQSDAVPSTIPTVAAAATTSPLQDQVTEAKFLERIPVALLSFQFAAQLVYVQIFGLSEVPTVVLTSVYFGLASDQHLLHVHNPKRNRRILAIASTAIGAIAGGWLVRSRAGIAGSLWIAAFLKFVISIAWLFWKKEETDLPSPSPS